MAKSDPIHLIKVANVNGSEIVITFSAKLPHEMDMIEVY